MTAPKRKSKSYYAWLAGRQRLPVPRTELNRMKPAPLKALAGGHDAPGPWGEYQALIAKSPWAKLKNAELAAELKARGLPHSGQTKETMVVTLETSAARREPALDEGQQKFLAATDAKILLHAGPGAGKTTTLCALAAAAAAADPYARILFLVYTKAAQRAIGEKIKKRGAKIRDRKAVTDGGPGIFSLTLNEYAFRRYPVQDGGFDAALRAAVEYPPQMWERWDAFILDEAQDIVPMHERLVRQIEAVSKRVIYAGDTRQQIYAGASFLTKVWGDKAFARHVLTNNHRSAPEIVALLNAFSREHFGEHHIEQVATSTAKGTIAVLGAGPGDPKGRFIAAGRRAAQEMCENPDSYCVMPVSVAKYYGTETAVTALRQAVCDLRGPLVKVLHKNSEKYDPTPTSILYVGTSYKLKGTEKDTAVVLQADVKYDQLNIERRSLACLLYVALSRPRRRLVVMLGGAKVRPDGLLACVAKFLKVGVIPAAAPAAFSLPSAVTVTDGLVKWPRPVAVAAREELAPLPRASEGAPDFLGYLAEFHLARRLGAPTTIDDIKCVPTAHRESFEYYFETYSVGVTGTSTGVGGDNSTTGVSDTTGGDKKRLVIKVRKEHLAAVQTLVGSLETSTSTEYGLAQLIYSARINKLWTLGEEFAEDEFGPLAPYAAALQKLGGPATARSVRYEHPIVPHRQVAGGPAPGRVVGVTDIEQAAHVVEVKHAVDSPEHCRQVCMYAAIAGKQAVLVNTKAGFVEVKAPLSPADRKHALDFARAKLAGAQATYVKIHTANRLDYGEIAFGVDGGTLDLVLAVDVETAAGFVVEVGAVLFSKADGEIVDVFHALSASVVAAKNPKTPKKENTSVAGLLAMCGFESADFDTAEDDEDALVKAFAAWRKRQSPHALLQWGGSDAKLLRIPLKDTRSIDMRRFYLAWLDQNGQGRKAETGLSEAVEHFFGPGFFLPHRAYEDAVATMALFIALDKK